MGRLWWVAVCLALPFSFATAASLELYTVPLAALQVRLPGRARAQAKAKAKGRAAARRACAPSARKNTLAAFMFFVCLEPPHTELKERAVTRAAQPRCGGGVAAA